MHCANCGTPIDDDSTFCINCGSKVQPSEERVSLSDPDETTVLETATNADETVALPNEADDASSSAETTVLPQDGIGTIIDNAPTTAIPAAAAPQPNLQQNFTKQMPVVQQASETAPKKSRNKKVPIIIAVVCVLIVAAVAIGIFATHQAKVHEETHVTTPVEFVFTYTGDQAEQPIGVPLLIQGTDLDSNHVEQQVLATTTGENLELLAGTYTISVVGDPVSKNGVVYQAQGNGTQELVIPVPSGNTAIQPIVPDLDITFAVIPAKEITDQQIEAIKSWMTSYGINPDEIQSITSAIANKRNEEVARITLEKEKQAALDANPSVIPGNPDEQQTQLAQLTGTVHVEYHEGYIPEIGGMNVCYLLLPKAVVFRGTPVEDPTENKVILPDSMSSYKGKVITISSVYYWSGTASTPEAEVSSIYAASNARVVRVFE